MQENILTPQIVNELLFKKPYVAFLDVLGFRSLVQNNSHEHLVDLYKLLMNFQIAFHQKYYNYETVKIVAISDSIILWTEDGSEKTLIKLIETVKFLLLHSIDIGIPLRGSIARENITAIQENGNISLVGLGLVKAYENEGIQNWSGCMIETQIIKSFENYHKTVLNNKTSFVQSLNSIVAETDIPIKIKKEEKTIKGYVVNWADNTELSEEDLRNSFSKFNKRLNESDDIKTSNEKKILNTLKFLEQFGSI